MIDSSVIPDGAARPLPFRIGLYEAIRRTAEAQRAAVDSDDLDSFYKLLLERERLLDKSDAVQQELGPADRAQAASIVTEILRLDQETERLLTDRIAETREELGDMALGRRALAGYGYVRRVGGEG